MDDTQAITVRDVRRHYGGRRGSGGFEAVRGVSFSVRTGELFALLGTNGAGKTSLLELIEGLDRPTTGLIRVLGHDPVEQRRLVRPRIGIMLQDSGFPGSLTVAETARTWAGTLTAPRPVPEVLELVGLENRARVRVRQLSGGEKRRLALALAVLGRPELLFLDEPTAGLDVEGRQHAWSLVRELLDGGTTVLLTTHYLEEAEELADRLAIMHQGRIARIGSPAQVAAGEPATVSCTLPAGLTEPLPDLPSAVATTQHQQSGGRCALVIRSHDPQATLTLLQTWASERGIELEQLGSRPATLREAVLAAAESSTPSEPSTASEPFTPEVAA